MVHTLKTETSMQAFKRELNDRNTGTQLISTWFHTIGVVIFSAGLLKVYLWFIEGFLKVH